MTGSRLIFYVAILVASLISTATRARPQETEVIAGGDSNIKTIARYVMASMAKATVSWPSFSPFLPRI